MTTKTLTNLLRLHIHFLQTKSLSRTEFYGVLSGFGLAKQHYVEVTALFEADRCTRENEIRNAVAESQLQIAKRRTEATETINKEQGRLSKAAQKVLKPIIATYRDNMAATKVEMGKLGLGS